jgi:arylformamidase
MRTGFFIAIVMTASRRIWDISAPLNHRTAVYPGDTPFTQSWTATITPSCPVNVSTIALSPHAGTHADAPLHYDNQGLGMGEVALEPFIGTCRVIHAIDCGRYITWQHLAHAITDDLPPRILVRTYAQHPTGWNDAFSGFAPDTVEQLAAHGVQLIGLDTPSVDPMHTQGLDSHMVVRQHDLRILESLVLDDVPEGDYELIALPLKLTHTDASPVRAILRSL